MNIIVTMYLEKYFNMWDLSLNKQTRRFKLCYLTCTCVLPALVKYHSTADRPVTACCWCCTPVTSHSPVTYHSSSRLKWP